MPAFSWLLVHYPCGKSLAYRCNLVPPRRPVNLLTCKDLSSFLTTQTLVASPVRESMELLQGRQVFDLLTGEAAFQAEWDAEVPHGLVLLPENNLSDLLDYDPKQNMPSRWEFLEQAMRRFGLGEKSFTWSENGCLLACGWLSQPGSGRAESMVPREAAVLEGIYCHPSFRSQFQSFLIVLLVRVNGLLNSSPVYACIASPDQILEQAFQVAGFMPIHQKKEAQPANYWEC